MLEGWYRFKSFSINRVRCLLVPPFWHLYNWCCCHILRRWRCNCCRRWNMGRFHDSGDTRRLKLGKVPRLKIKTVCSLWSFDCGRQPPNRFVWDAGFAILGKRFWTKDEAWIRSYQRIWNSLLRGQFRFDPSWSSLLWRTRRSCTSPWTSYWR